MAVSTLKTDNRANLGYTVDLSSYKNTDYIVPKDGYVVANCGASANAKAALRIYSKDNNQNFNVGGWSNGTYGTWSAFVKRGMRVRTTILENSGGVYFYPLED